MQLNYFGESTTPRPLKLNHSIKIRYLSSGLVVVEVHQRLRLCRLLAAFSAVPRVDERPRKRDAEVDVVAAAGPLQWKHF